MFSVHINNSINRLTGGCCGSSKSLIVMSVSYSGECVGRRDQQRGCGETRRQEKTVSSGEWMCHGRAEALQIDLFQQLWSFFVQL